ncbi:MAG TPA: transporter [Terriglobales bacterium]|nr:transporter [Terriglobales bacterium]
MKVPPLLLSRTWLLLALALMFWIGAVRTAAQDLEPRAYSASPVGVLFFGGSYTRMTGGVVLDASLPISDVNADINGVGIGIGYTFALAGRQALVTAGLPYAWGNISGNVQEQARSIYRSGLANAKFRFDINLHGSPAMTLKEFAQRKATYIVAASVLIDAPTGQYSGQKLINVGVNRFAFKPQIGASLPWKKFETGLYIGAWFYATNPDFFPGGVVRTQDPMPSLQGYASYTFKPHLWISLEGIWYGGGAAHLNDGPPTQRLNNSRLGGTFSLPLTRSQSVKVSYASGVTARFGTDFNTLSIGWQYTRLPKPQ